MRTRFGAPIVIAVLSLVGLVAALIGDGPADAIAWFGLAAPVVVVVWALVARRR